MRKLIWIAAALIANAPALADNGVVRSQTYEITITNITPGQTFTPILAATHKSSISFFELGSKASPELAELAESGSTAGLESLLASAPDLVFDTASTGGLLGPGMSTTIEIHARGPFTQFSLAGMLIPTNDNFVAMNNMRLPKRSASYMAVAYDAGSEFNDELCSSIPGPYCQGAGLSPGNGEGFVHVSSGVHGLADLDPGVFDWRNPIARIEVRRVH
jgi:hypothetical protein